MVKLSQKTINALKDDIMSILYENPLITRSTYEISKELRRDKEFTKNLLLELKKDKFVEEVKKGKRGEYLTRRKWKIPPQVLKAIDANSN